MAGSITFGDNNQILSRDSSGLYAVVDGIETPIGVSDLSEYVVLTTGDQTISGLKSFVGQVNSNFLSAFYVDANTLGVGAGGLGCSGNADFKRQITAHSGLSVSGMTDVYGVGNCLRVSPFPFNSTVTGAKSQFYNDGPNQISVIISGYASQSANLQEWRSRGGTGAYADYQGYIHSPNLIETNDNGGYDSQTIEGDLAVLGKVSGTNLVFNTGDQTISGIKTFSTGITAPNLVYNTGNQNISGNKTFFGTVNAATLIATNLDANVVSFGAGGFECNAQAVFPNGLISSGDIVSSGSFITYGAANFSGSSTFSGSTNRTSSDTFSATELTTSSQVSGMYDSVYFNNYEVDFKSNFGMDKTWTIDPSKSTSSYWPTNVTGVFGASVLKNLSGQHGTAFGLGVGGSGYSCSPRMAVGSKAKLRFAWGDTNLSSFVFNCFGWAQIQVNYTGTISVGTSSPVNSINIGNLFIGDFNTGRYYELTATQFATTGININLVAVNTSGLSSGASLNQNLAYTGDALINTHGTIVTNYIASTTVSPLYLNELIVRIPRKQ